MNQKQIAKLTWLAMILFSLALSGMVISIIKIKQLQYELRLPKKP